MVDRTYCQYPYDDDLIAATLRDGQTRVRAYRFTEKVAVLGSGSYAEAELHLDVCHKDRVPVLRRRGEGCAVILDPANVIVSVAATGIPFGHHRQQFDTLTTWLIEGLARIGMPGVSQAGICDLVLGDRKIGGACLHRSRDLLYYTVSLLVDPDLENVKRYLKHPPREPEYRRGRAHRDFMGSLAKSLAVDDSAGVGCNGTDSNCPTDHTSGANAEHVAELLRSTLRPPDLQQSPAVAA
ncbi:MAG: hypothetical protein KJ749_07510 [Planctomycetes bacterium]|nr:hypothetical protein [Planctomycetota bacterium]